jgi:predicted RNA-binding Zn-ribbon protein involved in translation (DUF1610 family)
MTEEKKSEKPQKKETPLLDEDVLELADVYMQLARELSGDDCPIKPTADALEAMAVSICINRQNQKRMDVREAQVVKESKGAQTAPVGGGAKQTGAIANEMECPTCGSVLMRRFPKDGRPSKGYFSCTKCRQYVNEDGSTKPW